MKKALVFILVVGGIAFAGSNRATVGSDKLPSQSTDGVRVEQATACRGTVYFNDGGTIMGGTLIPYLYNSNHAWGQGPSSLNCTLPTTYEIDGGSRKQSTCEWIVANRFGRVSIVGTNLIGEDAGPVTAIIDTECYGEKLLDSSNSSK